MKRLTIDGQRLVNEDGAQVILSGVNLVCKDRAKGYVHACGEDLFQWFRDQGYNVIRLGLIWDGVEPEPGVYDHVYLGRIKEQIRWAHKYGIYVFLDMHQDLYSSLYGDGAPPWATITDDLPHVAGSLWSDAYLESPAVNRALDHFWNNTLAVDGIGLQDHYAAMWKQAAEYMADCPNVIGYDMMNEPYPGTRGQEVLGAIMASYAHNVPEFQEMNLEELAGYWFDDTKKQDILAGMADMDTYRLLVDSASEASQSFEREVLAPLYAKTAAALRSADPDGLLMLETSYFANMGVESGLELIRDDQGKILHHQIYVPHGYDLVVDTDHYEIYNQARVDLIFAAHRRVQERLNVPVLIGEWGGFSYHPASFGLSQALLAIFEQYLWSHTYWCWDDGFRDSPSAKALQRAYPQETAGMLSKYHYEQDTGMLTVVYVPSGGRTVIYHPRAALLSEEDIHVVGSDDYRIGIDPFPESESGLVAVMVPRGDREVTLTMGVRMKI